jgi:hypothetical protein
MKEFTLKGKLVDAGNLDCGIGISLEIDGAIVDLTGLTEEQTRALGQWLMGEVTVTIRAD